MDIDVAARTRNQLGEGPVWVTREQALYWVDIPGKGLHIHWPETGKTRSMDLERRMTCIAPLAGGGFVCTYDAGFALLDDDTGFVRWLARPEAEIPTNRFNDGGVDPLGRFYCGTMNEDDRAPTGALYRLEADGGATAVADKISVSNSTAWSPDGRTLYFCDTSEALIRAYDYDPDSGAVGDMRIFATSEGIQGKPDGSAVDSEGYLWNARFRGWGLVRFAPDGSVDRIVELPVSCVTCCAFGGEDMKTLYITSASEPLSAEDKEAQPLAGALISIRVDVPGLVKPEANYAL